MMKFLRVVIYILLLLIPSLCFAAENLDELEARVSRKSVNTFYSGEDSGNYYIWQPMTVIYKDSSTNHEIWVWSQTDDVNCQTAATEYGVQHWSADGKRMGFSLNKSTAQWSQTSYNLMMVSRSDQSYLRPCIESTWRGMGGNRQNSFGWNPVEPDIAYQAGNNSNGRSGLDLNMVYRITITDTGNANDYASHVDLIGGDTATQRYWMGMKGAFSGDGKYMFCGGSASAAEGPPYYIVQVYPDASKQLVLTYSQPTLDTNWDTTPATPTSLHDECFAGNSAHGYWVYFNVSDAWWRMRPWGSDSNAPNHTSDTTSSGAPNWYDWWGDSGWNSAGNIPDNASEEIQPVNVKTGTGPAFQGHYWSHCQFDPWGTHVVFSGWNGHGAPEIWNVNSSTQTAWPAASKPVQYHTWNAYSDYAAGSGGTSVGSLYSMKYNDAAAFVDIGELHSATTGDFSHPGQSPDGTKASIRSDWLQPTNSVSDIFIGIAYFPYPPEITSCSATGGTVTTQFDWRHDQASPRTYTTRGWPDEDADAPCPPRETEKFRLWRSADKSTWAPLTTTNAEIFTRYDFSDGTWGGNSYWIITDTPGDGTWYYIVTSVEWSGLESRALSNIYSITVSSGSGTGSQDTVYPSSPGDLDNISASDFYTSYSSENASKLTRYYNIYAEDGSSPSISQTNRIASISHNACSGGDCSWVDWLGNTGGTTQFVVTAMDTQGNESTALSVTSTHQKSPATAIGQYTIEWDNIVESGGAGTSMSIGGSQTITLGGSQTLTIQ